MPIKSLFGKTYNIIERSLEITKLRHGLIASNIANLDTPDYKAKEIHFDKALESIKDSIGSDAVLVQYPVNAGPGFDSIVDIIQMKLYKYPKEGGKPEITDIPDSEAGQAEVLRNELIEKLRSLA